ncbi:MAG TPA: hypothetical protein V6C72_13230, partial [Chroococcales cyanobacterium]
EKLEKSQALKKTLAEHLEKSESEQQRWLLRMTLANAAGNQVLIKAANRRQQLSEQISAQLDAQMSTMDLAWSSLDELQQYNLKLQMELE